MCVASFSVDFFFLCELSLSRVLEIIKVIIVDSRLLRSNNCNCKTRAERAGFANHCSTCRWFIKQIKRVSLHDRQT